jgi:hypothetical protein
MVFGRRSRRSLENPMLYNNFVEQVMAIDPNFDIELIDRTLEPSEAKAELRRRGHLRGGESSFDPMREYRSSLHDSGIKHPRMQNFVMRQENPPTVDDLNMLSYVLGARPARNVRMDIARKARPARSVRQYSNHPNRYDITGVDTPGSIFDPDWF